MSPTFIHPIYIIILIIINIQKCYTLNNNITNLTTLTPTLAPTLSPTNITTTIIPTISPSKSPSKSPSTSPSISPSKSPSKAPTKSPSKSPSISPSISPTKSTTYKPTNNPTKTKFTTTNGKSINPTQQLLVNFTLNFTSSKESTTYTMDESLKLAYSYVGIPANYIQNYQYPLHIEIYYFYKIYSVINAKDKAQATDYQALIASDPETGSLFRDTLKEILLDNETNQHFDMSTIYMDVNPISTSSNGSSSSDTTQIIIWFLGVSAVCAIGALVLIICWRKFSGKDENENDNAINLEFLLDPNAPNDPNLLTSPMHINNDNDNDNKNNYSLHQPEDIENDEDLKPIKRKKKVKKKYFNRLQDDDDDDEYEEEEEEEEEEEDEEEEVDEIEEELQEQDNYAPPQFSERL